MDHAKVLRESEPNTQFPIYLLMSFRLVPKLVTLNDLEQRNGRIFCVISPNSVAFWGLLHKSC